MKNKSISEYTVIKRNDIINKDYIEIGVGLGKVDGLTPSEYFYHVTQNSKTYEELEQKIRTYYKDKKLTLVEESQKECDLVSINIAKYLEKSGFVFSPATLKSIHRFLFTDAFPQILERYVGVYRDVNIYKNEEVLGGRTVIYGDYEEISDLLEHYFGQEKQKRYSELSKAEQVLNIAKFITGVWQIHPFREGNTRTIAVFTVKYLQSKGFVINNDIFKENSKYFRDALVLASYENISENIECDFSYINSFFEKFILNKDVNLKPIISKIDKKPNLEKKNAENNFSISI